MKINKILILRFSSLGDIVMATAMIRCVRARFPQAQIDMVVRQDFIDLIRHNPHLNRKIALPRESGVGGLRRLLTDLNREGYDLIYDAHYSLRTLFLMPFLRAPYKRRYQKHYLARSLALTVKLPLFRSTRRMLERYVEPLEDFGVRYDAKGPEIFLPPNREAALARFGLKRSQSAERWIGIIPSAQWPGKRWPPERFRSVLEWVAYQTSHKAIVFGGKSDTFCAALTQGLPKDRIINTQGQLSLAESSALVSFCDLVIANDTGLMHVADALQVPSVLILGPTSAELGCLPFHPRARVLEHALWCRPCSKNGQAPCIRFTRHCLVRTSSEMVVQATQKLLKELGA